MPVLLSPILLGVPLGTFIGQLANWNMTFWLTAALGLLAFTISFYILPKNLAIRKSSLKNQLRLFTEPRIILAFFIPAFAIAGTYTLYTYITPIIQDGLGISSGYVSLILLAYGAFSILSKVIAGKVSAHNGMSKLRFLFLVQALILTSFFFAMNNSIAGLISIMLMAVMIYVRNAAGWTKKTQRCRRIKKLCRLDKQ